VHHKKQKIFSIAMFSGPEAEANCNCIILALDLASTTQAMNHMLNKYNCFKETFLI
jgi:hypothetical protein